MDGGACKAPVHRVAKSRTRVSPSLKKHDGKEVESLAAKSFLKDVFIDTL